MSALIPKLPGETYFPKLVIIDRAHRSLLPMPVEGGFGPSARPRTIIARVHHFQGKEKMIWSATVSSTVSQARFSFSLIVQLNWSSGMGSMILWELCVS